MFNSVLNDLQMYTIKKMKIINFKKLLALLFVFVLILQNPISNFRLSRSRSNKEELELMKNSSKNKKNLKDINFPLIKNKKYENVVSKVKQIFNKTKIIKNKNEENENNSKNKNENTLGNKKIDQSKMDTDAGTGYFKANWSGKKIDVSMADVKVENPNSVVAWGALYWQYFEDLDKITSFEETPLKLNKKLFKMVNSDQGPEMTELKEGSELSLGDKLQVRIELQVDRPMEYVHMKDMRASGFEPLNVLSQYKWQGGLGYYESTRDASTNFFISYLPKGTFVFEYAMVVNHKGDFSNGVTTIQCMYAPEFASHSEGARVKVQ